jgi:hypothetical protein
MLESVTGVLAPHLDLRKRQLRHMPDAVWERTDLETLVLADNALVEVPEFGRRWART